MEQWQKRKWLVILSIAALCAACSLYLTPPRDTAPAVMKERDRLEEQVQQKRKNTIRVYVSGAVNAPGLYDLPPGLRFQDAIHKAGGMTEDADACRVNLAKKCRDGSHINVPYLKRKDRRKAIAPPMQNGAVPERSQEAPPSGWSPAPGARVNLNTADAAQLQTLPGVGPAMARRIIEYRGTHPFTKVEDLLQVKGIGPAKLQKIAGKAEV
jgi:competence protein ComEA